MGALCSAAQSATAPSERRTESGTTHTAGTTTNEQETLGRATGATTQSGFNTGITGQNTASTGLTNTAGTTLGTGASTLEPYLQSYAQQLQGQYSPEQIAATQGRLGPNGFQMGAAGTAAAISQAGIDPRSIQAYMGPWQQQAEALRRLSDQDYAKKLSMATADQAMHHSLGNDTGHRTQLNALGEQQRSDDARDTALMNAGYSQAASLSTADVNARLAAARDAGTAGGYIQSATSGQALAPYSLMTQYGAGLTGAAGQAGRFNFGQNLGTSGTTNTGVNTGYNTGYNTNVGTNVNEQIQNTSGRGTNESTGETTGLRNTSQMGSPLGATAGLISAGLQMAPVIAALKDGGAVQGFGDGGGVAPEGRSFVDRLGDVGKTLGQVAPSLGGRYQQDSGGQKKEEDDLYGLKRLAAFQKQMAPQQSAQTQQPPLLGGMAYSEGGAVDSHSHLAAGGLAGGGGHDFASKVRHAFGHFHAMRKEAQGGGVQEANDGERRGYATQGDVPWGGNPSMASMAATAFNDAPAAAPSPTAGDGWAPSVAYGDPGWNTTVTPEGPSFADKLGNLGSALGKVAPSLGSRYQQDSGGQKKEEDDPYGLKRLAAFQKQMEAQQQPQPAAAGGIAYNDGGFVGERRGYKFGDAVIDDTQTPDPAEEPRADDGPDYMMRLRANETAPRGEPSFGSSLGSTLKKLLEPGYLRRDPKTGVPGAPSPLQDLSAMLGNLDVGYNGNPTVGSRVFEAHKEAMTRRQEAIANDRQAEDLYQKMYGEGRSGRPTMAGENHVPALTVAQVNARKALLQEQLDKKYRDKWGPEGTDEPVPTSGKAGAIPQARYAPYGAAARPEAQPQQQAAPSGGFTQEQAAKRVSEYVLSQPKASTENWNELKSDPQVGPFIREHIAKNGATGNALADANSFVQTAVSAPRTAVVTPGNTAPPSAKRATGLPEVAGAPPAPATAMPGPAESAPPPTRSIAEPTSGVPGAPEEMTLDNVTPPNRPRQQPVTDPEQLAAQRYLERDKARLQDMTVLNQPGVDALDKRIIEAEKMGKYMVPGKGFVPLPGYAESDARAAALKQGEEKSATENAAYHTSLSKGVKGAGTIAANQRQNIELLKILMADQNFASGSAVNWQVGARRALATAGFNPDAAKPNEVFDMIMGKVLQDQFAGLKSLSSEAGETASRVFAPMLAIEEKALPHATDTLEGKKMKVAILDNAGQLQMRWADHVNKYEARYGKLDPNFDMALRNEIGRARVWAGITPEDEQRAAAALKTGERPSAADRAAGRAPNLTPEQIVERAAAGKTVNVEGRPHRLDPRDGKLYPVETNAAPAPDAEALRQRAQLSPVERAAQNRAAREAETAKAPERAADAEARTQALRGNFDSDLATMSALEFARRYDGQRSSLTHSQLRRLNEVIGTLQ